MKIIVTEKPSVAKDIARVFKLDKRGEGFFEGKDYIATWAFGHLIGLQDPDGYDEKFKSWKYDDLPIIPDAFVTQLIDDAGVKKQFHTISMLMKRDDVDSVICATDAGREGELIFRLIYDKSGCEAPIERLWISSQTDQAIKEGFQALKPGASYEPLYDSAMSRAEADWLIGMNATRAYTIKCSRGSGVMSVGRVQTPVLKMIVDRYQEHTSFEPKTFWEIFAEVGHPNGSFKAKWFKEKEDRFFDQGPAEAIVEAVQAGGSGKVIKVSEKQKKEQPPLLYDLTELQRDANKKFKFSADQTLKLMQRLYEHHKILTYPRTSSRFLSKDIEPKLKGLVQNLSNVADYSDVAGSILDENMSIAKRMVNDAKVTDHHAIIPTDKKPDLAQLGVDERKIYDLVIRRFLAAFLGDCLKNLSEIVCEFSNETFRASGTVIKKPGWRNVYMDDPDVDAAPKKKGKKGKKDDDEPASLLPIVAEGDAVDPNEVTLQEGKTKAPPLYNEASILAAMETAGKQVEDEDLREAMKDCGLGTPATRAQILERLIKVGYITREKNRLVPTSKGQFLISTILDPSLLSPELTGQMEKKLNDMAQGSYDRNAYMEEVRIFTEGVVAQLGKTEVAGHNPNQTIIGVCPLCEGQVGEMKLSWSCLNWKSRGCTFAIWKAMAGKTVSEKVAKELLGKGKTKIIKGFKSKAGKKFDAALVIREGKVGFEFERAVLGDCPLCSSEVVETAKAFSCGSWRDTGCKFVIWKSIAKRTVSVEEAKVLLSEGRTEVLEGFQSKAGKPFSAALVLRDGRASFDF